MRDRIGQVWISKSDDEVFVIVRTRRHRSYDVSIHLPVCLSTGKLVSEWIEDDIDCWEDEFELTRII